MEKLEREPQVDLTVSQVGAMQASIMLWTAMWGLLLAAKAGWPIAYSLWVCLLPTCVAGLYTVVYFHPDEEFRKHVVRAVSVPGVSAFVWTQVLSPYGPLGTFVVTVVWQLPWFVSYGFIFPGSVAASAGHSLRLTPSGLQVAARPSEPHLAPPTMPDEDSESKSPDRSPDLDTRYAPSQDTDMNAVPASDTADKKGVPDAETLRPRRRQTKVKRFRMNKLTKTTARMRFAYEALLSSVDMASDIAYGVLLLSDGSVVVGVVILVLALVDSVIYDTLLNEPPQGKREKLRLAVLSTVGEVPIAAITIVTRNDSSAALAYTSIVITMLSVARRWMEYGVAAGLLPRWMDPAVAISMCCGAQTTTAPTATTTTTTTTTTTATTATTATTTTTTTTTATTVTSEPALETVEVQRVAEIAATPEAVTPTNTVLEVT